MGEVVRLQQHRDECSLQAPEQASGQTPDEAMVTLVRERSDLDRSWLKEMEELWISNGGKPDDQIVSDIQRLRDKVSRVELSPEEQRAITERAGRLLEESEISDFMHERILDILCSGR